MNNNILQKNKGRPRIYKSEEERQLIQKETQKKYKNKNKEKLREYGRHIYKRKCIDNMNDFKLIMVDNILVAKKVININKILNEMFISACIDDINNNATNIKHELIMYDRLKNCTKYTSIDNYIYIIRTNKCKYYVPRNGDIFNFGITHDIFETLCYFGDDVELLYCISFNHNITLMKREIIYGLNDIGCIEEKHMGALYYSGQLQSVYKMINDIIYTKLRCGKYCDIVNRTNIENIIPTFIESSFDTQYKHCTYDNNKFLYIVRYTGNSTCIYKYGFTNNLCKSIINMPHGTELIFVLNCENRNIESILKNEIESNIKFTYLNKYFVCDFKILLNIIDGIIIKKNIYHDITEKDNNMWYNKPIENLLTEQKLNDTNTQMNKFAKDINKNKRTYYDIASELHLEPMILFDLMYKITEIINT
jgi:hypothetical protein